jgi:WD40 domain-containing protein
LIALAAVLGPILQSASGPSSGQLSGELSGQISAQRRQIPISSLVVSEQGEVFAARGDSAVRLDLRGEQRGSVRLPRMERVAAVAFSAGRRLLAVGGGVVGRAGEVAILDAASLAVRAQTPEGTFADIVTALAWSENGESVVAGSSDRTARVLDGRTLATRSVLKGHTGAVLAVAAQGASVVTGSLDATIRIWDAGSGTLQRSLTNHSGPVTALAFEPSGSRLASGAEDRTVRLWDPSTGRLLRIIREHDAKILALAWGAGGELATGAADGWMRAMDAEEGTVKTLRRHPAGAWLYALSPLPGGGYVAGCESGLLTWQPGG